ncbi:MAG: OB-fold domain-containing protein [Mycobacteriaceae bacterium]|jgi:uncharacterized OB-fold protein|nr:OB-fold domain-containing protein [Mycobacteriaceae bacterium]
MRRPLEDGYFTMPGGDEQPRLIGSYSPSADTYFFPRRRRCPLTGGPVEDVLLSTTGELFAWTYVESAWMGKAPFGFTGDGHGVGQVDLPEGVRVQCVLRGEMGDWEIGMPMELEVYPIIIDADGIELCSFRFGPAGREAPL